MPEPEMAATTKAPSTPEEDTMQTADKFTAMAAGNREIVLTRIFDGVPAARLFEAWTRPELMRRWLGSRRHTMSVCEIDLRVGGAYRFVWSGPGMPDMGMGGIYREIVPSERLVATEAFDGWYEGESLVTTVLAEQDGRSTLTTTVRYPSREIRDMVMGSGMAGGVAESYDRLEDLLAADPGS
jgi:uncharacterized protein YndB with AHSA1/START domain